MEGKEPKVISNEEGARLTPSVVAFDDKGDRKDAEITIFVMKGGKIEPTAVVKGGKTVAYAEFLQSMGGGK